MKKDLSKFPDGANLYNTILIDDSPSYIAFGQEKNVLLIPPADLSDFICFHKDKDEFPKDMGEFILTINHIFYAAGMMSRILSRKSHCLRDNLFMLQYKSKGDGTYAFDRSMYDDLQYYRDGLIELQKVNPTLEFYGGELAKKFFAQPELSSRFRI